MTYLSTDSYTYPFVQLMSFTQANGRPAYVMYTDDNVFTVFITVSPGTYLIEWLDLDTSPPTAHSQSTTTTGQLMVTNLTRMPLVVTKTSP